VRGTGAHNIHRQTAAMLGSFWFRV
jgi:hypothetical protein